MNGKLVRAKSVLWCSHCRIHRYVAAPIFQFYTKRILWLSLVGAGAGWARAVAETVAGAPLHSTWRWRTTFASASIRSDDIKRCFLKCIQQCPWEKNRGNSSIEEKWPVKKGQWHESFWLCVLHRLVFTFFSEVSSCPVLYLRYYLRTK